MSSVTIVTKRAEACSVCGALVSRGEYARFSRAQGVWHLECDGQPTRRLNTKPAPCSRCRRMCGPGEAKLEVKETREGGAFKRRWVATCLRC